MINPPGLPPPRAPTGGLLPEEPPPPGQRDEAAAPPARPRLFRLSIPARFFRLSVSVSCSPATPTICPPGPALFACLCRAIPLPVSASFAHPCPRRSPVYTYIALPMPVLFVDRYPGYSPICIRTIRPPVSALLAHPRTCHSSLLTQVVIPRYAGTQAPHRDKTRNGARLGCGALPGRGAAAQRGSRGCRGRRPGRGRAGPGRAGQRGARRAGVRAARPLLPAASGLEVSEMVCTSSRCLADSREERACPGASAVAMASAGWWWWQDDEEEEEEGEEEHSLFPAPRRSRVNGSFMQFIGKRTPKSTCAPGGSIGEGVRVSVGVGTCRRVGAERPRGSGGSGLPVGEPPRGGRRSASARAARRAQKPPPPGGVRRRRASG